MVWGFLQAPYYYGTRTNYPYPPTPSGGIGYGGSFGTGSYSLGGGYYRGQSYLARPITRSDLLLSTRALGNGAPLTGYPYYVSEGVLGQVRPEYWLAQRRSFERIQPAHVPLIDERPVGW